MVNSFWENIFKKTKDNKNNVLDLLKGIPILGDLSKEELREFERIAHRRYFEPSEHIFWEGEPGVGMYIIKKGTVKIYKTSAEGKNEDLAILKDGDFFGELALLDESPRSASAIAMEACHILGFFRPEFFGILIDNRFFFQLIKWFLVFLALGLAVAFLIFMKHLMIACIIAIFLAFLLEPIVMTIENHDVKRTWAVAIAFTSITVIVTLGITFLLPSISAEFQSISALKYS
ncbi:MAG: AI-2E family transporter [Candidatus Brocadia sp.]